MTVEDVLVPERTRADLAFDVRVELRNDGPARDVTLFGALYERVEGRGPCGPATDPRFRGFTHLVQERVQLPARSSLSYPEPGDRWLHRYDRADAPAEPTVAELCIFVAEADSGPTAAVEYLAFGSAALSVRAENAPPEPRFTWTPEAPGATQDALFVAEAEDAEGDPVSYRWDFGHMNASGRAQATGARVTHFFYPAGEYVVTLTASDGLDEARATQTVVVGEAPGAEPERGIPAPWAAMVLGLLVVAFLRRR